MIDTSELEKLVSKAMDDRPKPLSKLGYFGKPFRPDTGPFQDKVIKNYNGQAQGDDVSRLCKLHDEYVNLLRKLDVAFPETEIIAVESGGKQIPVIIQSAIPEKYMMRAQMLGCDVQEALELMDAAGATIAKFWNNLTPDMGRVGFHPSIRNFAVIDKEAIFFDSFPPLLHYTHSEIGEILLMFSESALIRFIGPLFPSKLASIQDEWYSPSETVIGLVGSACRLRPEDNQHFLKWGREFATKKMPCFAEDIERGLSEPPKLPKYWTRFRKILGLEGAPNL